MTDIRILSFDPLQLELPTVDNGMIPAGELCVFVPPVHYIVADLSMGGILPGAHIGADLDGWHMRIKLSDPIPIGDVVAMLADSAPLWRSAWDGIQEVVTDKGPLIGGKS